MARIGKYWRIGADGSDAVREFDRVGDAGAKMEQKVRQGAAGMHPALRAVDAVAGELKGKMEGAAGSAGTLGKGLQAIGPIGFGVAAGIGALVLGFNQLSAAARAATDYFGEIYTASQRINTSVEFLQEWRYAMVQTGEDARIVDATLGRFAVKLGQVTSGLAPDVAKFFKSLGFTDAQIRDFKSVEEVLPQIADRISQLGTAAERAAILEGLGLKEMLPLLQQGSEAIDAARARARQLGIVLDEYTIRRAWDMGGAWDAAAQALDVKFKEAIVEFSPVAIRLTEDVLIPMATAIGDIVSQFESLDKRSNHALQNQARTSYEQLSILRQRYRDDMGAIDGSRPLSDLERGTIVAVDRYRYQRHLRTYNSVTAELEQDYRIPRMPGTPGTPLGFDPREEAAAEAAAKAERRRHEQVVESLRAEAAARADLDAIRAASPKITDQEAEALRALNVRMRELEAARAAGVLASQQEFEDLQRLAQAGYDAASAERALATAKAATLREMQARAAVDARAEQFRRGIESPEQRRAREEAEARAEYRASQGGSDPLTEADLQRRLDQIAESYRAMAEAQRDATASGELLNQILDGQITNLNDLGTAALRLLANAAYDSIRNAGRQGGDFASFGRNIITGIGDELGLPGQGGKESEAVRELGSAARDSAREMQRALTPSAAQSAIQLAFAARASQADANSKIQGVATMGALAKSASAAAAALAQVAAAGKGGDVASDFLTKAASYFFGGGGYGDLAKGSTSGGIKAGPGRMGGGDLWPGFRHPVVEDGRPEILLLGGGAARVLPNEDFEGLRLLSDLSRKASQSSAAPAAAGGVNVHVNVINQSGVEVETQTTQRRGASGGVEIDVMLRKRTAAAISNGELDDSMRTRFGATPILVPR